MTVQFVVRTDSLLMWYWINPHFIPGYGNYVNCPKNGLDYKVDMILWEDSDHCKIVLV